jgi:hypothetical protein
MSAIWPVRFDLLHSLHTGAVPLLLPSLVDGATLTSLPGDVDGAFRLRIAPPAGGRPPAYTNAQLADDHMPRRHHRWRPPLTLTLEARFAAPLGLMGTAGFGFWNDPAGMSRRRAPALPRALWFFWHSSYSALPLLFGKDDGAAGAGTGPAATFGYAASLNGSAYGVVRAVQWLRRRRQAGQGRFDGLDLLQAAPLPGFDEAWHCYQLAWHGACARWLVDGVEVFATRDAPTGRLALVIWIDNQFLVVRPDGRLRWQIKQGVTALATPQSLEIRRFEVEPGCQEI